MGNHHKPPQYNLQDMWVTFHACEEHSSYPNFFLAFLPSPLFLPVPPRRALPAHAVTSHPAHCTHGHGRFRSFTPGGDPGEKRGKELHYYFFF